MRFTYLSWPKCTVRYGMTDTCRVLLLLPSRLPRLQFSSVFSSPLLVASCILKFCSSSFAVLTILSFPVLGTIRQRVGDLRRGRGHHLVLSRRPSRGRASTGSRGDDEYGLHRVPARRHPCAVRRGQEELGAGSRGPLEKPFRY